MTRGEVRQTSVCRTPVSESHPQPDDKLKLVGHLTGGSMTQQRSPTTFSLSPDG